MNNFRFEDWENEQLEDPEFRAALDELEAANLVTRLRLKRGMTQAQLAEAVGTKQSSIARLESGASQPRLSFLRRVIEALGGRLELNVIDIEERAKQAEIKKILSMDANSAGSFYSALRPQGQFESYRFFWMVSPESSPSPWGRPQRVEL